ncbi:sensor histidine kinase [Marinigracilibium pacificum]|uniref:Histidine kinase n=1 Tax=Marinigracilibium pacificum TaxID=2729599 RepID=A0A848IYZ1_9BACT|nr:histidine kinase [Marinigracilibium pacificum]NMM47510.1 histidine kinase [Marinigracilibium pacificum]
MRILGIEFKEVHFRWVGIAIVSIIMSFVHPLSDGETYIPKLIKAFFFTSIYWNGAFLLFILFRKKFPLIKQTPKRLTLTFITLILFLLISDPLLCSVFHERTLAESLQPDVLLHNVSVNFIAALVVGSFYENAYFFDQWKNTIRINESLKNQQIRTQFEVLQNQMSPHFLFNSLNTLSVLITEDQQIAVDFTDSLSEVYRYILQNKEKDVVTLEQELDFVKSYVFLLQKRYPENLKVNINVEESTLKMHIPPLTLQILVENSIKHNIVSRSNPLTVDVFTENGKMVIVKNNLQPKRSLERSTKTGLDNIVKRYNFLSKQNIDIITTDENFLVAVPLLSIKTEKDHNLA